MMQENDRFDVQLTRRSNYIKIKPRLAIAIYIMGHTTQLCTYETSAADWTFYVLKVIFSCDQAALIGPLSLPLSLPPSLPLSLPLSVMELDY